MVAIRLLQVALVVVLLLTGYFLLVQERLIYFPRSYRAGDLAALKEAGGREIGFKTSQGSQFAYFLPPAEGGMPGKIWICFSGNGGTALDWVGFLDVVNPSDGYLLVDYPGYGKSEGKPSPKSIEEAGIGAVKAYAAATGMTVAGLRPKLRVLGHSMGCAAALMVADEFEIERGILVAPFTSTLELARKAVGAPLALLLRHRFDNVARLRKIENEKQKLHVTIFHGEWDGIIPPGMGERLAVEFPEMVSYRRIDRAGHNDVLDIGAASIAAEMAK